MDKRIHITNMVIGTTLTGVFIKDGDMYMAFFEEEPEAVSQGKTLEEAQANLCDAYNQIMLGRVELERRKLIIQSKVIKYHQQLEKTHKDSLVKVALSPSLCMPPSRP